MKKYLIIISLIFAAGLLYIILMFNYIVKPSNSQSHVTTTVNKEDASGINVNAIEEEELSFDELEPEANKNNQIFFENIDILYKYLKVNQVEYTKEKIQFYIQNIVSPSMLDCTLIADSLIMEGNILEFELRLPDKSIMRVVVKLDGDSKNPDVNILHVVSKNI